MSEWAHVLIGTVNKRNIKVGACLILEGGGCVFDHSAIYYYTPLPLNLANSNNKQQHVSVPFWPLLRPNASDLLPM